MRLFVGSRFSKVWLCLARLLVGSLSVLIGSPFRSSFGGGISTGHGCAMLLSVLHKWWVYTDQASSLGWLG